MNIINNICKRFGLNISFKKTKTMVFGDESSAESKSLFSVDGVEIENVRQFCYLGHTIYNTKNASYTDLRVSSALSKFNEIGNVLKDGEVNIKTRKKLLESCARSRLVYGTQSWFPSEAEMKKLETCWYGCLRKMVRGGYRRKRGNDGGDNFAFFYTNKDLEHIIKTPPLRDFMCVIYLKYVAHICRSPNTSLVKKSMFLIPKCKYYRDPWIKISKYLGGISINQCKRETQSRAGFTRLLTNIYPFLSNS